METFTCKQLIDLCKKHGIKNYSNKKKALIIDLINKSNISTVFANTRSHDRAIPIARSPDCAIPIARSPDCAIEYGDEKACAKKITITRTEVQNHGFIWESEILFKCFKLAPGSITYCNAMDIPQEKNMISYVNISIKTTCNPKVICMADAISLYKHTAKCETLHLLIIIYEQIDIGKKIKEIIEIDLQSAHELLFGDLSFAELSALNTLIRKVPQKRSPSAEEHSQMYSLRNELQKKCYLQLNIKCNSQQSRLQCSFNKFHEFLARYPERIIYRSYNNLYNDIELSEVLYIGPRTFKK